MPEIKEGSQLFVKSFFLIVTTPSASIPKERDLEPAVARAGLSFLFYNNKFLIP